MSKKSLVSWGAAALLSSVYPTWGQSFSLPDGPGKEVVENGCGTCHAINRLGVGYTPEGWRTIVHMMQNAEYGCASLARAVAGSN